MGLKKYILGSILLILIIAGYTFSIEAGDYRVQIMDYVLILPIAAWIVLPMVVLFIMTVLHILFYGLKNYFSIKAITKDSEALTSLVNQKLLKETSKLSFQNQNFKDVSAILNQLDIDITNSDFNSTNKEINKTIDYIFSIKSGKYISSKELKLDNHNPIMEQNLLNKVTQDDDFALEVIKKSSIYSKDIIKAGFLKTLEVKSFTTIKKLLDEVSLDEEMTVELLKKDGEQLDQFAMTNDVILKLIKKVNLTNQQLIIIAKNYKLLMAPDQIIKLYEDLSVENEEYTTAYLFVLAEYEMVDKMRDILDNSAQYEFIPFKALVDLKDAGKNIYSLDTLCFK
ncbi:MAG: hypothetical protein DRG78_17250 [Epsilonproteobacteria bacterium]|nr:MAG: hypothetical protein DRG78_17250 [Campylobacterota bacterium]